MNKKVLRNLSYGVYIITTMDKNRPTGCVANSAMQVTSSPATVAVSINHDNYTNGCIKASGFLALNVMNEDCDPAVLGVMGFQTGKEKDKLADIPYQMVEGCPVLENSFGYLLGKVVDTMETATHTVFLVEIQQSECMREGTPMTYAYYHQVVKGKAPKNAPTYIEEEAKEMKKETWVCGICGYEYDGDIPFEQLPEDYVCPLCRQPKSVFEKKGE